MKTHSFRIVLHGVPDDEDAYLDIAEALFGGGCDDSLLSSCEGVASITFDREAESYDEAVASAIANIQAAAGSLGVTVGDVLPEDPV